MSTNGAIFSTFKRTDSHTVRGRRTRKGGVVIYERIFRNGSFRELKIAKESHDLAKILLESNQKSNELSINRKCEESVTMDERRTFMKVLGVTAAGLAQSVERLIAEREVAGSIPGAGPILRVLK